MFVREQSAGIVSSLSALFCLVAACGNEGKPAHGSSAMVANQAIANKLRACQLLSEGEVQGLAYVAENDPAQLSACRLDCYDELAASAGCEQAQALVCGAEAAGKLKQCLKRCDAMDLDCDVGGETFTTGDLCDAVDQCTDRTDERGCVARTGICDDGQRAVTGPEQICDGHGDCRDGSDEVGCPVVDHCDGRRLPFYQVCDGKADCIDGADENDCSPDAYFRCKDGNGLVGRETVCDLRANCADGSDESVEQGCAQLSCSSS